MEFSSRTMGCRSGSISTQSSGHSVLQEEPQILKGWLISREVWNYLAWTPLVVTPTSDWFSPWLVDLTMGKWWGRWSPQSPWNSFTVDSCGPQSQVLVSFKWIAWDPVAAYFDSLPCQWPKGRSSQNVGNQQSELTRRIPWSWWMFLVYTVLVHRYIMISWYMIFGGDGIFSNTSTKITEYMSSFLDALEWYIPSRDIHLYLVGTS